MNFPFVRLEGAANFRDAGGQMTANGNLVRRGVLYRANRLSGLTEGDYSVLEPLNIAIVYDFRAEHERVKAPILWAKPKLRSWADPPSTNNWGDRVSAYPSTAEGARAFMTDMYRALPFALAPKIADIVRALAAGEGPCVVTCSAGKDRTGVAIAVLLALLGVPREAIEADYMRSHESTGLQNDQIAALASGAGRSGIAELPPEALSMMLSVQPAFLEGAFSAIAKIHGSFDSYARAGLGLGEAELEGYANTMLESAPGNPATV
ncbi:MAG: tyrosine-protein phosphatase [Hyphomonadaceae bacterium]|nr:tyrosine-protein phosphatase [Hyphomonadaceae bacterium]